MSVKHFIWALILG